MITKETPLITFDSTNYTAPRTEVFDANELFFPVGSPSRFINPDTTPNGSIYPFIVKLTHIDSGKQSTFQPVEGMRVELNPPGRWEAVIAIDSKDAPGGVGSGWRLAMADADSENPPDAIIQIIASYGRVEKPNSFEMSTGFEHLYTVAYNATVFVDVPHYSNNVYVHNNTDGILTLDVENWATGATVGEGIIEIEAGKTVSLPLRSAKLQLVPSGGTAGNCSVYCDCGG